MMWRIVNLVTEARNQLVDITATVRAKVTESGIKDGVCYVYIPHTTAGVTINENADPDVVRDLLRSLDRLVPTTGDYRHCEGNSDAHIKAALIGSNVVIPVIDGKLGLGTWQGIYFGEFDGPRHRAYKVGIAGSKEGTDDGEAMVSKGN
jgi:secondary thiamine-phosphate synthase enzyme